MFQELYNDNRELNEDSDGEVLRGEGEEIFLEEVEKAIDDMKNGKAAGIDNIKAEMLKALDEDNTKIIHKFCNKIHKSGKIPGNLSDSVFVTIPKQGKNNRMLRV